MRVVRGCICEGICCILLTLACTKTQNAPLYVNISQTSGDSFTPAVAVSSDGAVYVVWAESTGVNNCEIFFSENRGGGWSSGLNISNNTTYSVVPAIDIDESGNVHTCWWDFVYEGPDSRILYRMRTTEGTWDSIEVVAHTITSTDSNCALPRMVCDNAGDVYVVWGFYVGLGSRLLYRIRSNGSWSEAMVIPGEDAVNPAALATDGLRNLHIAYEGSDAIHYEMMTPSGTWQDYYTISDGVAMPLQPEIAVDGGGVAYVTWAEKNGHYYVHCSENAAGYWADPSSIPKENTDDIGFFSSIDAEDDGTLHIVWGNRTLDTIANAYGSAEVNYVRKYADGNWSDIHNISNTSAWSIVDVGSIAVDDLGNAHIVWADAELGNFEVFYFMVSRDSL